MIAQDPPGAGACDLRRAGGRAGGWAGGFLRLCFGPAAQHAQPASLTQGLTVFKQFGAERRVIGLFHTKKLNGSACILRSANLAWLLCSVSECEEIKGGGAQKRPYSWPEPGHAHCEWGILDGGTGPVRPYPRNDRRIFDMWWRFATASFGACFCNRAYPCARLCHLWLQSGRPGFLLCGAT